MNDHTARELQTRLDSIAVWLQTISGQLDMQLQVLGGDQKTRHLLELLVGQAMPAAPEITREITVTTGPPPTLLATNESLILRRIDITNDDPAQPLWVGAAGVLPSMGRVVLAQDTIPYVLPMGTSVFGVCVVPTISVRVSDLYNLVALAEASAGLLQV